MPGRTEPSPNRAGDDLWAAASLARDYGLGVSITIPRAPGSVQAARAVAEAAGVLLQVAIGPSAVHLRFAPGADLSAALAEAAAPAPAPGRRGGFPRRAALLGGLSALGLLLLAALRLAGA